MIVEIGMLARKYEFTGETMQHGGHVLHRIRMIKNNRLGGWIEKEANLSHEGECWVWGEAKVYGDAVVSDRAQVHGDAQVYGDARVCGGAQVYGGARVYGRALVHGGAEVYGDASVCGAAEVSGGYHLERQQRGHRFDAYVEVRDGRGPYCA